MEKQQHSESAARCQLRPTMGFHIYIYAQLLTRLVARMSFFTLRGMHDDLVYSSTPEEDARLRDIGMPAMILTSTFDLGFNQEAGRLTDNTLKQLRNFARVNRIQLADVGDFSANPIIGYSADRMDVTTVAGEWRNFLWSFRNDKGIPVLSLSCTENLTHALYPNYAEIAWNFMKHFARESKTGKLLYTLH